MIYAISILAFAAGAATVVAMNGRWRLAFAPFRIKPRQMTVSRLGLEVHDRSNIARVDRLLASFAEGFNAMITARSPEAAERHCDNQPMLFSPFAHEGMAMGYTLRNLFRFDGRSFERDLVMRRPELRYLYYVGLGFWSGMRRHSAARLEQITQDLDPLYRHLCYDGYGFACGFFDYPENPSALTRLHRITGYARNAAYQGVGRSLWFRFMDRPELLINEIDKLGEYAADAAAGVGLAAGYVNPDRLERAQAIGRELPLAWRQHFHLGLSFALKARSIQDPDQFEQDLAGMPQTVHEAVWASVRECDRIELQVRAERRPDGYAVWRSRMTQWLANHIEYPMAAMRQAASVDSADPMARV